ncbi:hypothetical protein DITRI_Ditri02bG0090200 [Diplodiscus trichospermus]
MLEPTRTSSSPSLKSKVYTPLESRRTSFSFKREVYDAWVLHLLRIDETSNQFMWYFLDVRHGTVSTESKMPHDFPCHSIAVACLNRLYVLVGDDGSFRSNEEGSLPGAIKSVFCFDLDKPDEGWTKAPSMLFGRLRPSSVAFNGKIYVFGGSVEHFAEVFDISQDSWA